MGKVIHLRDRKKTPKKKRPRNVKITKKEMEELQEEGQVLLVAFAEFLDRLNSFN